MRVLVCGGRDYRDEEAAFATLDQVHAEQPITLIIEGGQRTYENGKLVGGADLWGCRWTYRAGIGGLRFDADWSDLSHPDALIKTRRNGTRYDARAGFRRNQRMIDEGKPDLVVAFPGGKGTADMVARARKAGIEIREVR